MIMKFGNERPEKFAKGDVVKLVSGSPELAVQGYEEIYGNVICSWFVKTTHETALFAEESLELVRKVQSQK